ncbi:MAG TPA: TonB-dependent receptor [Vicinamibacterales bacterium]|nr:TonB-dependent receptor [Vicinamibacterales bacterium]
MAGSLHGVLRRLSFTVACAVALVPARLIAQPAAPVATAPAPAAPSRPAAAPRGAGAIAGKVTTQGTIPLAGASVSLQTRAGEVAASISDGDGAFRFDNLAPGSYIVVASLEGFDALTIPVVVTATAGAPVVADLRIATVSERVEVVASTAIVPSSGTITASDGLTGRELEEISGGGGLQSALRLLASVIEVPGGVSIKGGRPSQASVQLGPGAFVDPATGLSQVSLPDDAIDSVTVLPNPYAVEYGRFSSGLVLIRTRRAGDTWRTRLNNLEPAFRVERGSAINIKGISSFSPRVEAGGPLVKDKLFLQQAVQYRYRTNDVASRPQDELKRSHRFSSFSRIDANLSPRHSLVSAAGFFPARATQATLGTFIPPEASVDMKGSVNTAALTERSLWNDRFFTETTFEAHSYSTDVMPRGSAAMELLPETTLGNFFNRQHREATTFQFIESLSGTSHGWGGLHLYKAGVDLLHTRYSSSSASRSVFIRRSDGTLARRLDFTPVRTSQVINSTDLALYAQDRVQPGERWYVEYGARLDRDGVLGNYNLTPRVGAAFLLKKDGTSVLRSGYGLFFERTPSVAGVFTDYEAPTDTRFAADGQTPLRPPAVFTHVTDANLRTSRSLTWDLALDHRFSAKWATHVAVIDRRGHRELVLTEARSGADGALRLDSSGRSQYREFELGVHYTHGQRADLNVSYVRSVARSDLNAFTTFYDAVLWPVVGENGYGPARSDVPHRLLTRGRAAPLRNWLVVGALDWRSGLPYSVVNESLDFVGARNDRRFPAYVRVDAGLEHRFTFGKYRPWIGVRIDNALSSFLPSDVQANITSPAFGTFYNSEYRQARIQVRFER